MTLPITLPVGNLPDVGVLSYGGVKFEELFKSKMTGQAEWDRSHRVVKYVKYTLEVDGYIIATNSLPNDPTWSRLRYILQQPGLALTYSDRGFANFNINTTPNGLVDVCNGPHPKLLGFTPMGARLAAHITWQCEICLPEISARGRVASTGFQSPFSQGILAFNWSTDLSFQDDGYARYTVEGELEIARVNNRQDNLENYRAYTEPRLPAGFKPTHRTFKVDDAKRKINFNYAFSELPVMGLPIRCTGANGSYRVNNTKKIAMVNWQASLQASYKVVPIGPRREAYVRFLGLMRDRINAAYRGATCLITDGVPANPPPGPDLTRGVGIPIRPFSGPNLTTFPPGQAWLPPPGNPRAIIQSFGINEGLYEDSKTTSFECSWTFVTTFETLIRASGVWRKMGDCSGRRGFNNLDLWVCDMAHITGYTSWYDYGFRLNTEVVITADGNSRGPITPANKRAQTGANNLGDSDLNRVSAGAGLVRNGVDPDSGESPEDLIRLAGLVSPEASWLNYQIDFITELDPGIALHKTLPQRDDRVDTLSSVDLFNPKMESDTTHSVNTISNSTGVDILQRMSTSTYRVALRGFGVRAGYKVPVPGLTTFGGVAVSPSKQQVTGPRIVANYSGIPVYATAWLLWYDVPLPPRTQQKAPPNQAQRIGDVSNPPASIPVPVSVPELDDNPSFGGRVPTSGF